MSSDFDSIKRMIVNGKLSPQELQTIKALLNLRTSGKPTEEPKKSMEPIINKISRSTVLLHVSLSGYLKQETGRPLPPLEVMHERLPKSFKSIKYAAEILETECTELFQSVNQLELGAILYLFVDLAAQALKQNRKPLLVENLLEMAPQLAALLENAFPDYLKSGVELPQLLVMRNTPGKIVNLSSKKPLYKK